MVAKKKAKNKTVKKPVAKKKKATAKKKVVKKTAKNAQARKKPVAKPKQAVKKPAIKTLHCSEKNKMLAGVCGGIGEYLGIDSNIVRLVWIAVSLIGGIWSIVTSVVVYAIAALVMPKK